MKLDKIKKTQISRRLWWVLLSRGLGGTSDPPDYKSGCSEPAELTNFSIILRDFQFLISLSLLIAPDFKLYTSKYFNSQSPIPPVNPL